MMRGSVELHDHNTNHKNVADNYSSEQIANTQVTGITYCPFHLQTVISRKGFLGRIIVEPCLLCFYERKLTIASATTPTITNTNTNQLLISSTTQPQLNIYLNHLKQVNLFKL